jgi:hypothetical protein
MDRNVENSNSILELMKIAQYKYSKDSKKINDRSGAFSRLTRANRGKNLIRKV